METTILGYPRIGGRRELKKAAEARWAGRISADDLEEVASRLRRGTWATLRDAGLTAIPSNTFSLYDHVLDMAVLFGAVPERFAGLSGLDAYFAMARGADGVPPLEMTKWFDTNYHFLVPEVGPGTRLRLAGSKSLAECRGSVAGYRDPAGPAGPVVVPAAGQAGRAGILPAGSAGSAA